MLPGCSFAISSVLHAWAPVVDGLPAVLDPLVTLGSACVTRCVCPSIDASVAPFDALVASLGSVVDAVRSPFDTVVASIPSLLGANVSPVVATAHNHALGGREAVASACLGQAFAADPARGYPTVLFVVSPLRVVAAFAAKAPIAWHPASAIIVSGDPNGIAACCRWSPVCRIPVTITPVSGYPNISITVLGTPVSADPGSLRRPVPGNPDCTVASVLWLPVPGLPHAVVPMPVDPNVSIAMLSTPMPGDPVAVIAAVGRGPISGLNGSGGAASGDLSIAPNRHSSLRSTYIRCGAVADKTHR